MENQELAEKTWQTIGGILSRSTTKATYNVHISPLKAIGRQNGTLTLSCRPNSLEWLEKRLYEPILRAAQDVDATIQKVVFVVTSDDEGGAVDSGAAGGDKLALEGAYHRQADAVIKPHKVEVHTQYFRRKWRPKLGPLLSELVRELRQRCYYGQGDGQKRDTVEVTMPDLAVSLGVSRSTILRALERDDSGQFSNPLLHYFVRDTETVREYDPKKGKMVNKSTMFRVYLDEPLTPEDEAKLNGETCSNGQNDR